MSSRLQLENTSGLNIFQSITRWVSRNPQRMTEMLVVSGVLLASILMQFLPVKYLLAPIALMVAGAAVIIYLRYPPLGVLAFIFATLAVALEVGTSTNTTINIAVMMLPALFGLWFADMMIRKRKIQIVRSRAIYPLIAFAIACLLSFGSGQLPWIVYARAAPIMAQVAGLALFLLSAVAFLLVANLITDLRWLRWMTWVFLAIGGFYFLTRLFPATNQFFAQIFPRGVGGSLLWVWFIAMSMSQALINRELSRGKRALLWGLTFYLLYAGLVWSYDWKSGWIPSVAAVWIILFFRYPRIAILLALVGLIMMRDVPAVVIASDEYSYSTRVIAWEIIWKNLIRVNPILGLGPANYYYYTQLFPILGYYVPFNSHNNYVDIIAQVGFLGLALFLWFVAEIGILGLRLHQKLGQTYGFAQAYVVGALAGLAGSLVAGMLGDWIIPFVYNVGVRGFRSSVFAWLFLGGLVVIEQVIKRQDSSAGGSMGCAKEPGG